MFVSIDEFDDPQLPVPFGFAFTIKESHHPRLAG